MKSSLPRKQKGAAAIEFALVFVIFFAVFYGMLSYSLPLLLMQSFHQAAAEGVRRSVSLDPITAGAGYSALVVQRAKDATQAQLNWIPGSLKFLPGYITATYTNNLLTVKITYPSANIKAVLPALVLPGVGTVPNLPTNLTATSSLHF
ncbi:pilus assembly protein [Pseudomonas sp. PA-3-11C]|uniref:TadE family protein n=1 Tax=unclassified Pseudomonas TaxID=196821 RepID=UPI001F24C5B5|nr:MULTISPECIES: TadE/TadG family type IV pilus assembly protein [unclassified Pseudomonas]MCF5506825.1 pilus assembly protein [Pseudomonas sp. PA-3-6H]MCF5513928.1 pilus assembly protein [Pseudomonas sp. PA-3-6E]MCF5562089.1 pilus assembly protein [Pseudomonas sp. PA-3-5D]MCF5565368.1 pilus assembly protein [Pseudomonas sp. PA-3-11C]MCF5593074.1 pilus assembly protein [Pseudomonas sp. PA-3-10C]